VLNTKNNKSPGDTLRTAAMGAAASGLTSIIMTGDVKYEPDPSSPYAYVCSTSSSPTLSGSVLQTLSGVAGLVTPSQAVTAMGVFSYDPSLLPSSGANKIQQLTPGKQYYASVGGQLVDGPEFAGGSGPVASGAAFTTFEVDHPSSGVAEGATLVVQREGAQVGTAVASHTLVLR
jgi:hypothetical protein